jgi:hypothetical protein
MKFAIDYDDVISLDPTFFLVLTQALKAQDHEMYIVSDFDEYFRNQREEELRHDQIVYDKLIITSKKTEFCKANGIDYAIDDLAEEYYTTSTFTKVSIVRINKQITT